MACSTAAVSTLLMAQLKGIVAVAVYTLVVSLIFWFVVKAVMGLRVSKEEEINGLDQGEHGEEAYVIFAPTPAGVQSRSRLRAFLNCSGGARCAAGHTIRRIT